MTDPFEVDSKDIPENENKPKKRQRSEFSLWFERRFRELEAEGKSPLDIVAQMQSEWLAHDYHGPKP